MDRYLIEAMREVDAMLPNSPPIAPARKTVTPWWYHFGGIIHPITGMLHIPGYQPVDPLAVQLYGIEVMKRL